VHPPRQRDLFLRARCHGGMQSPEARAEAWLLRAARSTRARKHLYRAQHRGGLWPYVARW